MHAVVVGGSLSGLGAGLALVRAGWTATIVERAVGEPPGGALPGASGADVPSALGHHERERLPLVRDLVSSGMAWGRSYLSTDRAVW